MKTKHGYHVRIESAVFDSGERYFMAYCIEWPECYAQGSTPHEALDILNDVIDDFILLSVGDELGYPLPYAEAITVGALASVVMTFDLNVRRH
jgi:predicted RNase H-like HicB family nuclease